MSTPGHMPGVGRHFPGLESPTPDLPPSTCPSVQHCQVALLSPWSCSSRGWRCSEWVMEQHRGLLAMAPRPLGQGGDVSHPRHSP